MKGGNKIKIKSTCLFKKYSYICQTINQLKIKKWKDLYSKQTK